MRISHITTGFMSIALALALSLAAAAQSSASSPSPQSEPATAAPPSSSAQPQGEPAQAAPAQSEPAQAPPSQPAPAAPSQSGASAQSGPGQAQAHAQSQGEEDNPLNLTDEQKAKLRPIVADETQQLDAVRNDSSLIRFVKTHRQRSKRSSPPNNCKSWPICSRRPGNSRARLQASLRNRSNNPIDTRAVAA